MQDEQVRVGDKTLRANEVVVPDILFLGVMVSRSDQELLEYAYRSAIRTHTLILGRERDQTACKKQFAIDVPDLGFIARQLLKHEREELHCFMQVFQALVNHLLPDAAVGQYTLDGRSMAEVKYRGLAWVSNDP